MDEAKIQYLIEELRINCGRNPKLDRDIDIALGFARQCTDRGRHCDNYVMPLYREDWILPHRFTWSVEVAMSLVPEAQKEAILVEALASLEHSPHNKWKALASRIVRCALLSHFSETFVIQPLIAGY